MSAAVSNRVLAVAAAGWIEHTVVDETPGPRARETFLSHEPRSWALFRAAAELSRICCLKEAADHDEWALTIDPKNIGALVEQAHLRRRDGHFEGAEALASHAIDLIDERNLAQRRSRNDDNPNWYRAQIVLTTIHAEWAKDLESKGEQGEADSLRERAYERAATVAQAANDSPARECRRRQGAEACPTRGQHPLLAPIESTLEGLARQVDVRSSPRGRAVHAARNDLQTGCASAGRGELPRSWPAASERDDLELGGRHGQCPA